MNMVIVPNGPERETAAKPGPKQDRAALSDAFERQVRQTARQAFGAAKTGEIPSEATEQDPEGGDARQDPLQTTKEPEGNDLKGPKHPREQEAPNKAGPGAEAVARQRPSDGRALEGRKEAPASVQDVLGLLAAAAETAASARATSGEAVSAAPAGERILTPAMPGTPPAIAATAVPELPTQLREASPRLRLEAQRTSSPLGEGRLMPTAGSEVAEAESLEIADFVSAPRPLQKNSEEAPVRARARLEVVHQETHFEPIMHEGVLVETSGDVPPGHPAARSSDLLQILVPRPQDAPIPADVGTRQDSFLSRQEGAPVRRAELGWERRAERVAAAERLVAGGQERLPTVSAPAASASANVAVPSLAPVASQVAARIIDAFGAPPPADSPADRPSTAETHVRLRAGGAAMKTLTIQLQPEHLGTLNVSMRLREGQLTLELAASRADTAQVLMEDKAALKALLEKAGFSVDEAAISVVAREAPAGQAPGQGAREPDGGAGRGWDRPSEQNLQGNGRDGRRREEEGERDPSRARAAVPNVEPALSVPRRSGTIFL